jgi:hypothetical protein
MDKRERLIKNRLAADNFRKRQKQEKIDNQARLQAVEIDNLLLKKKLADLSLISEHLSKENKLLKEHLEMLKQQKELISLDYYSILGMSKSSIFTVYGPKQDLCGCIVLTHGPVTAL